MADIQERACQHLKQAQIRQQRNHDLRARATPYQEGGFVLVKDHQRRKGMSPKLQRLWTGPAVVVQSMGPVLCKIREKKKLWVLHYDQLKPYQGLDVPMWVTCFDPHWDEVRLGCLNERGAHLGTGRASPMRWSQETRPMAPNLHRVRLAAHQSCVTL